MNERTAPPPLDLLLARRDWVRRFARTLARDDAAAEDLEQDAWLAAVERTPPHAERPAGWLRRVMTRRAMDVARAERRRVAHETAAARPDATGDIADVVATAEVHRRVVEAVLALDEPYRTTVLLRYFDGLPPRSSTQASLDGRPRRPMCARAAPPLLHAPSADTPTSPK